MYTTSNIAATSPGAHRAIEQIITRAKTCSGPKNTIKNGPGRRAAKRGGGANRALVSRVSAAA
jgi:hypothetical protein